MSTVVIRPGGPSEPQYLSTRNYSSAVRQQMQMFQQQQHQQQQQLHHHQPLHHHPVSLLNTPINNNYLQSNNCKTESLPEQQPPSLSKTSNNSNQNNNNNNVVTPHFEYVSYDRVQDLYEQRKGHFYFIPEGFEPVLVPNDSKAQTVTNLLETSKPVSAAPNVSRMLPDTDVRLPSFALPCGVSGPSKKEVTPNGKVPKVKKPPRPPNAFILYRRAKQPTIVAQHQGITNNEVSKEIGKMWHEEPMEVRLKFQKMAEAAKEEHMKKYPEYRYRPRRPQERKRRVQTRESTNRRSSVSTMVENSEYVPRRVPSISSDGGDNGYNGSPSVSTIQNQQVYYSSSEVNSPSENYRMSDNPTMPPQFTPYVQPPMNDYNVFEAQPQNMSEDGMEFTDFEDYNGYNQQIASLMGSAEHYPQYVTKNDY